MEIWTIVYIAAPVTVVICCVAGCTLVFFRCFIIDRNKPPSYVVSIRYIQDRVEIPPDNIDFVSPMTKRRRRKQRIRQVAAYLASKVAVDLPMDYDMDNYDQTDLEEGGQDDEVTNVNTNVRPLRQSIMGLRASFLNFISFGGISSTSASPTSKRGNQARRKKTQTSSFILGNMETSTKSKRFISQDRLDRAEARKSLYGTSIEEAIHAMEETIDEADGEDQAKARRIAEIVQRRKQQREMAKSESLSRGEVDVIAINAGPSPEEVPPGFAMVEFISNNNADEIMYKRILYKWDGDEANLNKPKGWFIATIVGTSRKEGCNFNIKYDRAETGSRFVDGMHAVDLALSGDGAYGRRWVLIDWIGEGKRPAKILAILKQNQMLKVQAEATTY